MASKSNLQQLRATLLEIETTAQSLESRHATLAIEVDAQSERASISIANDKKALAQQLVRTSRSLTHTISTSNALTVPSHPLLSFASYVPLVSNVLTTKDTLTTACTTLVKNFTALATLAGEANDRLNGIYRSTLQIEDEIGLVAHSLSELDSRLADLDDLEQELEDVETELADLEEAQEEAQKELEDTRLGEYIWDEERRHQKKKSRWLWAVAPVTCGLSVLPAMYASHERRGARRFRDASRDRARKLGTEIEEARERKSELEELVPEYEGANQQLETFIDSTSKVSRENQALTKLIQAKCEGYLSLKEETVAMATKTRSLQGKVEMLEYTDGVEDVQKIMLGLVDDLKRGRMTKLDGQGGLKLLLD